MPEENTTTENSEAVETTTEGQPDGTQEGAKEEAKGIESLPEWAQSELRRARDDAAGYRTRLRDAEAKLAKAKTPEEYDAAITELSQKNAELIRANDARDAAASAGLPLTMAPRLQGASPEELLADAKALKESLGIGAPQPRQGSGGGGLNPKDSGLGDLEGTPREIADAMKRRSYRVR